MPCCRKRLPPSSAPESTRWSRAMPDACYILPVVYIAREKRCACCIWPNYSTCATHRRRARVHLGTERFPEHATRALSDAPLQQALQLLVDNFVPRRVAAMAALGNAEELRSRARAIKEQAIARLDAYLECFATQVQQLGAQVHWAA